MRYSSASFGSIITLSATRRHSSWNVSCDSTWNVLMTPYPLMSIFTSGFVSPTLSIGAVVVCPVAAPPAAPPAPELSPPQNHRTIIFQIQKCGDEKEQKQTGKRLLWW